MTAKLTDAQRRALNMVAKRDWPAGEPRLGWLHNSTAAVLLRRGLIAEREGTGNSVSTLMWKTPIIDLTDAGRAALGGSEPEKRP